MARFKTLDQADVAGKRVLVRADLNVPMKAGVVGDATRLQRLAPTLRTLASKGAKVVVLSHFDRPKGKRVPEMSLAPVAQKLSQILGQTVAFADDCIGPDAQKIVSGLSNGQIAVLENLRYHKGEEANDPLFARNLAALGDVYVNDAFSAAHRAHASTEAITHLLPAFAGLQMQAELEALAAALESPQKPVMAIVGGSKVSTKLDLLSNLVARVNVLVIGGGMANTFLFAQGIDVGNSLCERDLVDTARQVDSIPPAKMILDVGPASTQTIIHQLGLCKTLLWNGPVGAFETKPFDQATMGIAHAAASLTKAGSLVSIAGGGDTVAALNAANVSSDFTYMSTAGGAFLEWLEGKELPGVKALAG